MVEEGSMTEWEGRGEGREDGERTARQREGEVEGGWRVEGAGGKGKGGELAPALHILRIISSFHERAWVRGY